MRHPSQRLPVSALTLSALLLALASASGCGAATGALGPPQGGGGGASIVTRSANAQVSSQAPRTQVSASCQAGEQMIGGGFAASDTFEYDAWIVGSYPSSANSWTAIAASSSPFLLMVQVYCLSASPALGVTTVQKAINTTGSVACPTGAILLSGGFQGDSPAPASRPDGNGWYAAGAVGSAGRVYALCARQHVSAGGDVFASLDPHSSAHSYYPATQSMNCPAGQTATAGGFSGGDLVLASASSGPPYQGWAFTAGGDGDLTLYVHCASITA